jgi:CRISPR system Cascade subunit CasE
MPYLSKIRINPMRESGRDMFANPQVVHAMVQQGIATQPVTERTLWRWEHSNPHQPHLLVLTETRPDWMHIAEQAGWTHADGEHFLIRDYQPLFDQLALGREFAFKLTANPVQNTRNPIKPTPAQAERVAQDPKIRGHRLGHRTAAHQLAWLLKKQERCGFTIPVTTLPEGDDGTEPVRVPNVRVIARDIVRFKKGKDRNAPSVSLAVATFEGVLTVSDTVALRATLLNGIGPAKAYGCGLLTLAPLPGTAHG